MSILFFFSLYNGDMSLYNNVDISLVTLQQSENLPVFSQIDAGISSGGNRILEKTDGEREGATGHP